jgi:hypothetical protein
MKLRNLLIVGLTLFSLAATFAPFLASADHAVLKSNVFSIDTLKGPLLVCIGAQPVGSTSGSELPTCSSLCDVIAEGAQIIYFVIALIIWAIAPIIVAISGVMYMLAGTNPGMITRAKTMLTGVVWGLAITLCAWVIVYTFVHFLGGFSHFIGGFGGDQAACSVQ